MIGSVAHLRGINTRNVSWTSEGTYHVNPPQQYIRAVQRIWESETSSYLLLLLVELKAIRGLYYILSKPRLRQDHKET